MRIDERKTDDRALISILLVALPPSAATSSYSIQLNPSPRRFVRVFVGSSAIKTEVIGSGWKKVMLTEAGVTGTGFRLKYRPPFRNTFSARQDSAVVYPPSAPTRTTVTIK